MIEISMTQLIVSVVFVVVTYMALGWAVWMGYRGINAEAPAFKEGGHATGAEGTYDEHCHIGDRSCGELRKAKAA